VGAIRRVAEPVADLLGPMPDRALQTIVDPLWPKGIRSYFKATNLAGLDDRLIDRLCQLHLVAPGPQYEIHVHQMGGAIGRIADGATAFAERSMPYLLNAVAAWRDEQLGRQGINRPRPCQFPGRPRRGADFLRQGDICAARFAQERVRPQERVPAKSEHRADHRLLTNAPRGCVTASRSAVPCRAGRRS
jgi:hypothetical protein